MIKILLFFKKYYIYIIGLIICLIVFDYSSIIKAFIDIPYNFKNGTIFYRFSTNNQDTWLSLLERTEYYFLDIILWIKNFHFVTFLNNIIQFTFDFLIYFTNYFLNLLIYLYLFFYMFISKDVYEVKYTRSAKALVQSVAFLKKVKLYFLSYLGHLKNNKKKIALSLTLILLSNAFLIHLISETFIFLYYYAISSYNLNLHMVFWYLIKAIILFIYIKIPLWITIITFFILLWKLALYRAEMKKEQNHNNLKVFVKYDLPFQTIVNGVPGVGKTRLLVQLALAIEETYYDELEETIKAIEAQHPNINFGEVLRNKYLHTTKYPEHYHYYKLLNRKTSSIMTVPFALLDPYNESLSHQLDFNYIRPNVKSSSAPLEKFTVLVISELDKEYNSHYSKKEVGEDGLHVFFGIGSHWFERTSKILIDYQISTQVPLNIRGNAEMFIKIEETKYKMPFLLNIFSLPFKWLYQISEKIISSYESYKIKLTKYSQRNTKSIRKRFDYTFLYSFLRYSLFYLEKVLLFFRNFLYLRFYCRILDIENNPIRKVKININNFDESWKGSRLYDSTFLSKAYKDKKVKGFDWDKIPRWTSLTPSQEELTKVHSRFIDSAFNPSSEKGDTYYDDKTISEFN